MNQTKKEKRQFWNLCILICTLVLSCKNNPTRHSESDPKYQLGLNLPADVKYYYTIINEMQTEVEYDGKKVETANKSELGLVYEISKDSLDNLLLKLIYDKFHIVLKDQNGEQEINAANGVSSYDPVGKILNNIVGSSLNVTLSPKGDVLQVTGSKQISDKILTALNAQDANTRKTVEQQISKLVGESFIKNNLEQGFKIFPDTAVYEGDSWQQKTSQTGEIKFDAITTYTLESVKKDVAHITSETTIDNPSNTSNVMGYEVMSNMKGTQKGYFETDVKTGMLLKSESSTALNGSMQIMGREVPIEIKVMKTIKSEKKN